MKKASPILYRITRSRRTRRMRIAIRCDASVVVTAPHFFPAWMIARFVEKHIGWIRRARSRMRAYRQAWILPGSGQQFVACREKAMEFILERLHIQNARYGFSYHRVTVKDMTSRWGSCSSKNNLNFHYRLLFLPAALAEYVVAHELCHLKHRNHSKEFWRLVAETIPDYSRRRRELRTYRLSSSQPRGPAS
ncbi:MAG: M48 family metallopeptidase [Patescibacteria group bacterium]